MTETSSAIIIEDKLASQQQQQQPRIDRESSSKTPHSTPTKQTKWNHKGKTFFVDKNSGCPILSTDLIVNLKRNKLIAIERACEFPK